MKPRGRRSNNRLPPYSKRGARFGKIIISMASFILEAAQIGSLHFIFVHTPSD
jgi:hypothetical protein